MPNIVILGAGISGLSLAWFLKKQFKENLTLTILEQNLCPGGWIKTITKEGILFELGPRSCRTAGNGLKTLQLIEELKLEDQVIVAHPTAKNRYVYVNQKMEKLPSSLFSFLRSPLTKGAVIGICKDIFGKSKKPVDESIEAFITSKFGSTVSENLFDPLTSGIYAGDIRKLSLKSCFPVLYETEKKYGSLIKGMLFSPKQNKELLSPFVKKLKKQSIFSLKKGMQTLTNALADTLKEHILFSHPVTKLEISDRHTTIYVNEKKVVADYVFSTLAPHTMVKLVANPDMQEILEPLVATSVAVVSLGFKKTFPKTEGFGYLIPSKEKEDILGVVFDSSCFKEQNSKECETRLTVMIGGAHFVDFESYSEEDFLKMALKAISKHLNINDIPFVSHVEIAKNAIPQYLIGHSEQVTALQTYLPSHFQVIGSSYFGVSVNDCIAKSEEIASQYIEMSKL